MRTLTISILLVLAISILGNGQAMPPAAEEHRTITQVLDRSVTNMQQEFTSGAEAMPDNKYDFAPKVTAVQGRPNFRRTDPPRCRGELRIRRCHSERETTRDIGGENGPTSIKTKADILKYLADSFTYVHKAIASIDEKNVVEMVKSPFGEGKVTRLGLATLTVGHGFDHYGQMVVYLRMNGIVPPASRQ